MTFVCVVPSLFSLGLGVGVVDKFQHAASDPSDERSCTTTANVPDVLFTSRLASRGTGHLLGYLVSATCRRAPPLGCCATCQSLATDFSGDSLGRHSRERRAPWRPVRRCFRGFLGNGTQLLSTVPPRVLPPIPSSCSVPERIVSHLPFTSDEDNDQDECVSSALHWFLSGGNLVPPTSATVFIGSRFRRSSFFLFLRFPACV